MTTGPWTINSPISPTRQFLGLVERGDRTVDDADDFPLDAGKLSADAHAGPPGVSWRRVSPSTSLAEIEATGSDSVAP